MSADSPIYLTPSVPQLGWERPSGEMAVRWHLPLRQGGHSSEEGVPVGLSQPLLQDLGTFLHLAQLLAVALDLLLNVGQRAGGVGLQLLQHGFLPLPQESVQPLKGLPDGGPQALGRGLCGGITIGVMGKSKWDPA